MVTCWKARQGAICTVLSVAAGQRSLAGHAFSRKRKGSGHNRDTHVSGWNVIYSRCAFVSPLMVNYGGGILCQVYVH